MKMIATTRLNKAQEAMRVAKSYGEASGVIFKEAKADEAAKEGGGEQKALYIIVSSDRGLCGGIHSSVTKKVPSPLFVLMREEWHVET